MLTETALKDSAILEDVAGLLSSSDLPHLFTGKELQHICAAQKLDCQRQGAAIDRSALYDMFLLKARRNLHIAVCVQPQTEQLSSLLRNFPDLVNRCTVCFVGQWPDAALSDIGRGKIFELEINKLLKVEDNITNSGYTNNSERSSQDHLKKDLG